MEYNYIYNTAQTPPKLLYNNAQNTGHTMLPQSHFCRTIYILFTQNTYDTSLAYIWT